MIILTFAQTDDAADVPFIAIRILPGLTYFFHPIPILSGNQMYWGVIFIANLTKADTPAVLL